uniref:Transmembrane protein n=1 Tax=Alexandrium monilatum TaxID=311494 RepID=A0A7S4Q7Z8_9DINO|mmetsp:Transcript_80987/g.241326  ORF Transcript_80987/g.241326 Transcript_80987/m.241326 type:complete len:389 (-) Transcript_80987:149-1315(-)
MSPHRSGCGPRCGFPSLLALLLPALLGRSAAVNVDARLLDANLLQAAQTTRATQAVAEAAVQAVFAASAAPALPAGLAPQAAFVASAVPALPASPAPQADPPPLPPIEDAAQLRVENDRLRHERAQLAEDVLRLQQQSTVREAQWQRERERLAKEETELRQEDLQLRKEDSNLRQALSQATDGGNRRETSLLLRGGLGSRTQKTSRRGKLAIVLAVLVAVGCAGFVFCSGTCMNEDPGSEDDEENLRDLVYRSREAPLVSLFRCFCRPYILMFTCGTGFVSVAFGLLLWEIGLLQPILSQLMVYAYVMGIVVLFIALMAYEIYILVIRSAAVVLDKFNHPIARARKTLIKKNKRLDWCDDGEHNPVIGMAPGRWGDRERRNALWQTAA